MRIALGIEYNGKDFFGWQRQQNLPTIQGHLESALSQIANESILLTCAGRTDAGVHASGQVVHFDTTAVREISAWTLGVNSYLPASISVRWAQEVDHDFSARFSALFRRYRYVIHNQAVRSALFAARATWCPHPLNPELMQQGAQYLLGELDFTSFRSSQCESNTPMRNVHEIQIKQYAEFIIVEIQANAFLHHMVRNIVGSLMLVGRGEKNPIWIQELIMAKDRRMAAGTASAAGLYLVKVQYPDKYPLPNAQNTVLFL